MLMSARTQGLLFALMTEQDMDDDARHDFLETMLPGVSSFTHVTQGDASKLIEALTTPQPCDTLDTEGATS